MAFDKVVDSASLDAGLTQIANAIREKGGTSDQLSFPAGMLEAIAAIETGGSGVASGTITPASGGIQTITHGLGRQPQGVVIFQTEKSPESKESGLYAAAGDQSGQFGVVYLINTMATLIDVPISEFRQNVYIYAADTETFGVALYSLADTAAVTTLFVGVEYRWYAW